MKTLNLSLTLLILTLFNIPVLSHNIKTDGNVGVTFHIEPEHSPSAKEPSQAWFVLTRQGGKIIPLSECDCQLKVYNSQQQLVQTPTLTPLSPEKYQNIPGADITFSDPGIYNLELTGKSIKNDFDAFAVTYTVTVTPSLTPKTQTSDTNTSQNNEMSNTKIAETIPTSSNNFSLPITATLVTLAGILSIGSFWWLKNKQQ